MAVLNELKPGLDEKLYEMRSFWNCKAEGTQSNNNANTPSFIAVISSAT